MATEALSIYSSWDLTQPISPPRSHLYSLPPIGIGTPDVESLTGYVARLADAHCVPLGNLIANEFGCLVKQTGKQSYLHSMSQRTEALNGIGQMAREFVQALQQLTLQENLYYLTLLMWTEVLPARGLLRRIRAWCPLCYEEWRTNNLTVYEPLLWVLEAIKFCPRHQQPLSSQCPHCSRLLAPLSWHSQPGYCAKCHQWLGSSSETTTSQSFSTLELQRQLWITKNVGELLAYTPHLSKALTRENVSKALSVYVERITGGNIAEFARRLRVPKNTLWLWHSGTVLPQLPMLLKLCQALEILLLEFLLDRESLEMTGKLTTPHPEQFNHQRLAANFDADQLRQSLEAALREDPPLSMQVIAQRLGGNTQSLRRRFPELCRAISARHLKHREGIRIANVEQSCQEARQIALKLFSEGIEPTRSYITPYLSKPVYFREAAVIDTLATVRQELGLE